MWRGTGPVLVLLAVWWQVPPCPASCPLYGLTAACSFKNLHWVPTLPSNITMLFLEFNHISEINRTSLRALEHLQRIDLGRQSVPLLLRNNAFLRQRRLLVLVLGFNPGLRLEPRAFAGLFNLRQLYLDQCSLNQSVLSGSYLEPLLSLETLDLFGNMINRLQPGAFFLKLRGFRELNLKLNKIKQICQGDLAGFTGKNFTLLSLHSTGLAAMSAKGFDWETCGNPFQGIAFDQLDLSSNLLSVQSSEKFFKAIEGTPIRHLILSGHIGKGFSYEWQPDPDRRTFEGLRNSEVDLFDLSKNYIFALQSELFGPLRNVTIVDVSVNKINQIRPGAFRGIEGHVRALNLSYNLLGEVHSYMFFNLTELRLLDLSQNHIGALGIGAFDGLPRLRTLLLTGNSLRQLHTVAPLPNLEYLHLADNKLMSPYHMGVFAANSTYVDISENKLTDLGDVYKILSRFGRLQKLFYGGNFVKWCNPDSRFPVPVNNSLQVLDLHDSSLQILWAQERCLDLFAHMDNLLALNISFNSLATLPPGVFSGLSSILEIDLSFNALTYLEPDVFPSSLRNLDLSNNFLASVDPAPLGDLFFLNLARNRFHCDCALWGFLAWLNVTHVTVWGTSADYLCEFPAAEHSRPLLDFSLEVQPCDRDDEPSVRGLRLALLLFWGAAVASLTLGGLLYARLRGTIFRLYKRALGRVLEGPRPPAPPEDLSRYDAYLCYSQRDSAWVEEALLGKLDQQFSERNPLRCCFEARDFLPGEDHLSNIRDAVWSSTKTVCVVSNRFLQDGWCLEAFLLAQGRMLEELTDILIMLVVGKMQHYQLMRHEALRAFVQRKEYLCWPEDPQDLDWFYQCLFSKILTQKKVRMAGQDRAEQEQEQEQEQARAEQGQEQEQEQEQARAEQGQEAIPMQEFRAQRHPGPREEPLGYREEQLYEVRMEQLENDRDEQPQEEQRRGVREEQLHEVGEEQLDNDRDEQPQEEQRQGVREEHLHEAREEQLWYGREEQLEYAIEEHLHEVRQEQLEDGREGRQEEQLQGVREEQLHEVREEQLEYGREEQLEYAREEQLEYGRGELPQRGQVQGVREPQLQGVIEERL